MSEREAMKLAAGRRSGRAVRLTMTAVAAVLVLLLGWRAQGSIDPYFDTFAYHLPFAARLAGLCPDTCYRMHPFLEARFDGFPKLYHLLQAGIWRLTGTPQAVDALTLALLAGFAVYLRRRFAVPVAWTLVGLLAVPLIQIHATSSYIDLSLNLVIAVAILAMMDLMRDGDPPGWWRPLLVIGCLAFVANSKLTMIPLAGALWLWLFAVLAVPALRRRGSAPEIAPARRRWLGLTGLALVSAGLVFASAWHNLLAFANPVYPLQVGIAGLRLPGPEVAMQPKADSLLPYWQRVPSPLRWLASVLELGGYGERPLPWTHDEGSCLTAPVLELCRPSTAPTFRMGGYFVAYVLFLLVFLTDRVRRQPPDARRVVLVTLAMVTLLAAFFPHSHELRYVMFWIITLVALVLICSFSPAFAPDASCGAHRVLATGMLVALASVVLLTRGHYLMPAGPTVDSLARQLTITTRVQAIADGAVVCVDPGWQPFTSLFAPVFHPGRSYTVLDGPIGPCTTTIGPPAAPPTTPAAANG